MDEERDIRRKIESTQADPLYPSWDQERVWNEIQKETRPEFSRYWVVAAVAACMAGWLIKAGLLGMVSREPENIVKTQNFTLDDSFEPLSHTFDSSIFVPLCPPPLNFESSSVSVKTTFPILLTLDRVKNDSIPRFPYCSPKVTKR